MVKKTVISFTFVIVYSVQNIIHKTVDSSISKIYYIQYNMFNNNEHSILHMISETLISSVIQLKLDILLMKLQSYKARNSSTEYRECIRRSDFNSLLKVL